MLEGNIINMWSFLKIDIVNLIELLGNIGDWQVDQQIIQLGEFLICKFHYIIVQYLFL